MEMKLVTKEQKSILAKLLAAENLTVEHGKYTTASFDVKNRVLRLPIWKEMSGSLYDLLVLHEVGHALFTPEEGLHDAKGHGKGFKSFLNVVEDARIERKIKIKFPGGRRSFTSGYEDLMKRDFFGIKGLDVNSLGLIDRINLHYKAGDHLDISFSDTEREFIDRIDKSETWKNVVSICKDLYDYAKENESETDMSDHDFGEMKMSDEFSEEDSGGEYEESFSEESSEDTLDGSGGSGEDSGEESMFKDNPFGDSDDDSSEESDSADSANKEESGDKDESDDMSDSTPEGGSGSEGGTSGDFNPEPESKTDTNFRNNESELVSDEAKPYRYLNIPTNIDLKNVIINYSDLYELYHKHYEDMREGWRTEDGSGQVKYSTEKFKEFRTRNKKVVEYLAKEFEMKKAAKDHARAATANSGILDSERLHTYKYNEHLFKKLTVIPDGKNHGLVMFVDWSGSMSSNMKGTIEQMMVLVMFCKRVNIPFDVYAFSDSFGRYDDDRKKSCTDSDGYFIGKGGSSQFGDLAVPHFQLLNLFSSRMKAKDLHDAYIYMTATALHYENQYSYGRGRDSYVSIPDRMSLGGTPLDSTLIMSFSVMRDFIKRNQVDVINSIFLTDGDSHTNHSYWKVPEDSRTKGQFDIRGENVILRDSISKKQIQVGKGTDRWNRQAMTSTLVKFLREVFDINIVNFFLVPKVRKWDMLRYLDDMKRDKGDKSTTNPEELDIVMRKFRKDKFMIQPEMIGFNELYMILGGRYLEVNEEKLEVAEDASVAQLTRAFKSFSKGKLEKRKLLSRFIDMVAA